jgi:hypothetical protein
LVAIVSASHYRFRYDSGRLGYQYQRLKYHRIRVDQPFLAELCPASGRIDRRVKALHPLGAAPLIEVDGTLLAESANR